MTARIRSGAVSPIRRQGVGTGSEGRVPGLAGSRSGPGLIRGGGAGIGVCRGSTVIVLDGPSSEARRRRCAGFMVTSMVAVAGGVPCRGLPESRSLWVMTCAPGAAAADSPPRASVRRSAPRREGSAYAARRCVTAASTSPREPAGQQLCTLHPRRGAEQARELVATFYEPGDVAAVARTVLGFGGEAVVAIDAPSGPPARPPGAGRAAARAARAARRALRALAGVRRAALPPRLPLYPVPAAGQALPGGSAGSPSASTLFAALDGLGLYRPRRGAALEAPVGEGALRFGRLCETYPRRGVLRAARPSSVAQAHPVGAAAAHRRAAPARVVDDDGGLWHRTLDELDACAAAYAAYALAEGGGCWVGDPREGVVVLPVDALADRYEPLPPPRAARSPSAYWLRSTTTVVALTIAVAGVAGLELQLVGRLARHQRHDAVRPAGEVDLGHDAVAAHVEDDAVQAVARAAARRRSRARAAAARARRTHPALLAARSKRRARRAPSGAGCRC